MVVQKWLSLSEPESLTLLTQKYIIKMYPESIQPNQKHHKVLSLYSFWLYPAISFSVFQEEFLNITLY
jgi:hypothetical protein